MPVVAGGFIYVASGGDLFWGKNEASVQAIDGDGKLVWKAPVRNHVVGTPAAHLSNPLQRRARDLMVAQHFPSFDISIYENAGRVILGLEPEGLGW